MRQAMPRVVSAALTPAALLCLASPAAAEGFATARFGGEHGTPVSANPTAIYYNPAAIAPATGIHLLADATIVLRRDTYRHAPHPTDTPEPAGAEGANTDEATLVNLAAVPTLAATARLGDFAVGAGFFVPFGGGTHWSPNERFASQRAYPGLVDGSQRWHSMDGTLQLFYGSVAAAYTLGRTGLSVGVVGNLVRSEITSIQARTAVGDNSIEDEGRSLLDVGAWAGAFGVGILWRTPDDRLWLGASYQSRPNVAGGHTLAGRLKNDFGSVDEVDVELHQDVPDVVRLGVRFRPRRDIELRLFGDWTRWSAFSDQCVALAGEPCEVDADGRAVSRPPPLQTIRRGWRDAFGLRAGGSLWVSPRWELFSGVGWDGNAIPDETLEPSLLDFDDLGTALGARVEAVSGKLFLELSYTNFFNVPRDTAGKSRTAAPSESFARAPDSGGHYTEWAGMLNVVAEAVF